MQPNVGDILEGKVTGITNFGAFVTLPGGKNGLVHISEISNSYVNDIHEHLSDGQTVNVKVIGINEGGKINLSIKQLEAPPAPRPAPKPSQRPAAPRPASRPTPPPADSSGDQSFEDKLKQFMQDSDKKIADSRIYSDKKGSYRRRRD